MSKKLRLNLQHFAEQGDNPQGEPDTDNQTDENLEGKDDQQGEKTFTQEEVDQILKERLAREKKNKEDAVKEAEKLAKMNKDQKAEYEREQMQKELDAYKAKEARNEMKQTAKDMLKEKDIGADDELLEIVTADTADQTSENVKAFTDVLNKMVKEQVQAKLTQGTPKSFQATGSLSREDIMNIQDDSQRQRAIAQNRHLF
ncbi:hypothetical protein AWC37_10505 [Staphylococcus xylosus]|uniref:DUF4355 domain-containing protein n=1 Tax=Staphylococcus xylosus TaxID=1288 RepID=UPI0009BD9E62|nr:DUF4355 domain-containing protein [Staphylococcus xylosus]ARD75533.1 hypothetical protein AWC37_10505 [Staphylococcus xylosus]